MKIAIPTQKELDEHDGCCMCFEDGYTLEELMKLDNTPGVINQAKLLLEFGYDKEDKFCEECFWK